MRSRPGRLLCAALVLLAVLPAVSLATPEELRGQLERAEARMADLDAEVSAAVEDYNESAALLARLQDRLADTQGVVDQLHADVEQLEDASTAFLRALHMRGPTSELTAVLSSDEVGQVGRDLQTLDRLSRQRQGTLEELAARRILLDEARSELEAQVAEAGTREAELADRRASVEAALAEQQADVQSLRDEIAAIERRQAAEAERRAREQAQREAAEQARLDAETAAQEPTEEETEEAAPAPPPPPEPAAAPPPGTRASAQAAVDAAMSQVGKPYRWGGSGPDSYDCSGLTAWGWAHAGVSLPHSSRMQFAATTRIGRADLQPGDLIFFGSPIHHVAMYVGSGNVVEAPYSGTTVRVNGSALSRGDIAGYGRV